MADVAFLLLVFFLVVAGIRSDVGLPVTLPPAFATGSQGVASLMTVLVGADGAVLVDGEPVAPEAVRSTVAAYARQPGVPHVALQAHRGTPYDAYVAALDAVLIGHRDAGAQPHLTLRDPASAE